MSLVRGGVSGTALCVSQALRLPGRSCGHGGEIWLTPAAHRGPRASSGGHGAPRIPSSREILRWELIHWERGEKWWQFEEIRVGDLKHIHHCHVELSLEGMMGDL